MVETKESITDEIIGELNNSYFYSVFIEGYRYHQNARPDIFANISDED